MFEPNLVIRQRRKTLDLKHKLISNNKTSSKAKLKKVSYAYLLTIIMLANIFLFPRMCNEAVLLTHLQVEHLLPDFSFFFFFFSFKLVPFEPFCSPFHLRPKHQTHVCPVYLFYIAFSCVHLYIALE